MILFLAQLLSRRTNADVGSTVGHMGLERALLHTDSHTEFPLKFNPLNLWIKFGISVELDRVGDILQRVVRDCLPNDLPIICNTKVKNAPLVIGESTQRLNSFFQQRGRTFELDAFGFTVC